MAATSKTEQTNRKNHYAEYSFHFSGQRSTAKSGRIAGPGKTSFLVAAAARSDDQTYIRAPTPWNGYSIDMGLE